MSSSHWTQQFPDMETLEKVLRVVTREELKPSPGKPTSLEDPEITWILKDEKAHGIIQDHISDALLMRTGDLTSSKDNSPNCPRPLLFFNLSHELLNGKYFIEIWITAEVARQSGKAPGGSKSALKSKEKWCDFHKAKLHNTLECRTLQSAGKCQKKKGK
ncbi:hypothetical protein SERLADRAFT_435476 [Serpula lacrymans var. lacrymans S7.9]|uniref:Uncharacterized protein n=1 Tax=Serpula lacrymans var. lacrymans (strain S7.9) TaxID=578457 RepID=F8NPM5_SERL9|nr:uncharacterized protein SERLADRAFT_435476 [Serpula lacrymans var. lacrymans S7.9]EGO27716.1 hypothetical protein SERLADRAFT_435476 [Serpula lacrymans var. lacrymans S7.9]